MMFATDVQRNAYAFHSARSGRSVIEIARECGKTRQAIYHRIKKHLETVVCDRG